MKEQSQKQYIINQQQKKEGVIKYKKQIKQIKLQFTQQQMKDWFKWYYRQQWNFTNLAIMQDKITPKFLSFIQQLQIYALRTKNQFFGIHPNIHLFNINYRKLTRLALTQATLQSLQKLQLINIPQLKCFIIRYLQENSKNFIIPTLKSIRKCTFPDLIEFNICTSDKKQDKYKEAIQNFTQCNFKELQNLNIRSIQQQYLFKIQSYDKDKICKNNTELYNKYKKMVKRLKIKQKWEYGE